MSNSTVATKIALRLLTFSVFLSPYPVWMLTAYFKGAQLIQVFDSKTGLMIVVLVIAWNFAGFVQLYGMANYEIDRSMIVRWLSIAVLFTAPALLLPLFGMPVLATVNSLFPSLSGP